MLKKKLTFSYFFLLILFSILDVYAVNSLEKAKIAMTGTLFESRATSQSADIAQQLPAQKKDWTLMIYIAADNDLRSFAARNIKQMSTVGSNEFINILVHLDIKITGNKKITRRYYIQNGTITAMNADDPKTARMDSGDPETLISFADWAITNYPADHYGLILWDHGTGIINPNLGRIASPSHLFTLNTLTNKWELDRSIGFLDFVNNISNQSRGICWDDTTGNYLTDQTLEYALKTIQERFLDNGKLSLIGFDACLMSMLEITNVLKHYACYCVSSEDVEMGLGWNYHEVLLPFMKHTLTPDQLAGHIVQAYEKTYAKITNDYTLSAINLEMVEDLECSVNELSQKLIQAISIEKHSSVSRWIKTSKSAHTCTRFDEPSYIDLHHFLHNLEQNIQNFEFIDNKDKQSTLNEILNSIHSCTNIIERAVIENVAGPNLSKARGISIYFPDKKIHSSYKKCTFAKHNSWHRLISTLLHT